MTLGWLGNSQVHKLPSLPQRTPPFPKEGRPTGWFDGVALERGQISGAGRVIKLNPDTEFRWMLNSGSSMNNRVDLLGVWDLLNLASRLHLLDLKVFGDSRIVIDWLNQNCVLHVLNLACWKD